MAHLDKFLEPVLGGECSFPSILDTRPHTPGFCWMTYSSIQVTISQEEDQAIEEGAIRSLQTAYLSV